MGHTNHSAFQNTGLFIEHQLDLLGVDIIAAGNDQILVSADDMNIAVFIHQPEIAGDEKPILPQFGGSFLGHLPVAFKHIGPADFDLAHLPLRQHLSGAGIGDLQLDIRQRQPNRASLARTIVWVGSVHVGFGHAVALQNTMPGARFKLVMGFSQQRG